MINTVALVGRLTHQPELKFTRNGKTYTQFNVAVQRKFKNENGEYEADFIGCTLWGKSAETFTKFTRKGSLVGVEGRLQTRNYEKDGRKIYITEVIAESFTLLETKATTEARNNQTQETIEFSEDDLPF
nr:MAG TPA: Single strand binding protein [Caudoviricetes sp.]